MHVYKIKKIRKKYAYFLIEIYPFTDPATNPLIKKRCKEKKMNKGTVMDIKAPVVKISQFSPLDPNNSLSFAVKIISLGCLSKKTRPTSKSFHTQRNCKINIDAKAGIDNGITILTKVS